MQQKLFCSKNNKEQDCTYCLCQWQVSNLWQGQIHNENNVIHKHVHTNFFNVSHKPQLFTMLLSFTSLA